MDLWSYFFGGSNVLEALQDRQRTINFYPESTQAPNAKVTGTMRRTEGIHLTYSVGDDPVTCLFYQDGRAFGVSGTQFLEFFDDDTYLVRGTVAFDGVDRPTISSNGSAGNQLLVTSGGHGYIYGLLTDVLTIIADTDFPANVTMGKFWAGYFFVLVRNSRTIQWSALEDGTDWDPLDVFEPSWSSDNVVFIEALSTNLYCVGSQNSEVLYLTGDITVVAPLAGVLMGFGSLARQTAAVIDDTLFWLDQNALGGGLLVVAKGYQPQAISTYAINLQVQRYSGALTTATAINNAIGFAMQLQGHVLYWLQINNGTQETTLVFDQTEGKWHERAVWNPTDCVWEPHEAICHMYAFERHYVGDRSTGAVYELNAAYLDDDVAA